MNVIANRDALDQLRERALELLAREKRKLLTGEVAVMLQEPTHRVHLALDAALHRREVGVDTRAGAWFAQEPDVRPAPFDETQGRLA